MSVLAVLVCAPLANATLTINYQIGAGLVTTCAVGPDAGTICSVSEPGLTMTFIGSTSNAPGTPSVAQQFNSTNLISYSGSVPETVKIWFTAQGFMMPTGPGLLYTSELAGTSTLGNTGEQTLSGQSCIDPTNGVAPPMGCAGGQLNHADQMFLGAASNDETITTVVGSLGTPYALQQQITLSLNRQAELGFHSSESLTAVPEPGSIVLLGTLVAGLATFIRRRAASRV